jgi:porin
VSPRDGRNGTILSGVNAMPVLRHVRRSKTRLILSVAILMSPMLATQAQANDPSPSWRDSDTLTGDWNGHRPTLEEDGYDIRMSLSWQGAHAFDGGRETGSASNRDVRLSSQFDLDRLLGMPGATFKFGLIERHGTDLGAKRTGSFGRVQNLAGAGLDFRLADLAYQQTFAERRGTLALGLLHSGGDFATVPIVFDFQNNVYSPRALSIGDNSGFAGYPVTQWGVRMQWEAAPGLAVQAAAYEINDDRVRHHHGWRLGFKGKAALLPIELVWKPATNENRLSGMYRLGAYYDSSNEADVLARQRQGRRWGAWLVGQQQLWSGHGDIERGLHAFTQLHVYDRQTAMFRSQVSLGLVQQGTFAGRREDSIGLAFAYLEVNPRRIRHQRELGESHPQVGETTLELYYNYRLARWLALRPNLQYIHRPGGSNRYADAWVGGLTLDFVL